MPWPLSSNKPRSVQVLAQLDRCAAEFTFPVMDNGYIYPAAVRLSVFADAVVWAIVIEVLGYNNRGLDFDNCLHCFGSMLKGKPGIGNENFLFPIMDGPSGSLFTDGDLDVIHPQTHDLRIRGDVIAFPHEVSAYASRSIPRSDPTRLYAFELLRYLAIDHRDSLLASEAELNDRLTRSIPLILRLDEWYHPDITNREKPRECPTFVQIAQVIETLNPVGYRILEPPNTHWSNWPGAGSL